MKPPIIVNDTHSKLNATNVARVLRPAGVAALRAVVRAAGKTGAQLALAGARHAMGGQQFAAGHWLLDTRGHNRVRGFDRERGLITVDAGIQWPELIAGYQARQSDRDGGPCWGIRQKQTGADRLTLGGALAANVHGRGLQFAPVVQDVESFTLIDAAGDVLRCSRTENGELFRLAIGGYGMFGVVADVTLRLMPRLKLQRRVRVMTLAEFMALPLTDSRTALYGDFQFSIDERSADFLQRGIASLYARIGDDEPMPIAQKQLGPADFERLLHLAHTDRARAFRDYASYYLSTDGQRYWSDTHQLSAYVDNYHESLDRRLGVQHRGSEMITELYVPRDRLVGFMARAAELLRPAVAPVIYGTVRMIERDAETFLAWARERWACVVFNLHVDHTPAGIAAAQWTFRALIDLALEFGGTYYLTYHRWARADQVERAHPSLREFLGLKRRFDPEERFTSDWYRTHCDLLELRHAEADPSKDQLAARVIAA